MKIRIQLFLSTTFLLLIPFFGFAQDCSDSELGDEYCLLAPIPGLGETIDPGQSSLGEYLNLLYQSGVGLAIALAVVALIIGGLQYMTSESMGGKSGGRERITAAIVGLLLALGSFVLITFVSGTGALNLDFSAAATNPAPPPPPIEEDYNELPEGAFCAASFEIAEADWFTEGEFWRHSGLPECPLAFKEKVDANSIGRLFGSSTSLTEEELVEYLNDGGQTILREQCKFQVPAARAIVNIDMSQCQQRADETGLLDAGTAEACFEQEKREAVSLSEREIFCNTGSIAKNERGAKSDYEKILFKLEMNGAPFDEPGACYQLSADGVRSFAAEDACRAAGGEIRTYDEFPELEEGFYCIAEATEAECDSLTTFSLGDLGDGGWDNSCDARTNFSYAFAEYGGEYMHALEDLYDDFTSTLGHNRQTSGYYLDEKYLQVSEKYNDGEPHAGIDIAGATGSDINTPVAGRVVELWPQNDSGEDYSYTNNGKIGVIDDLGRLWVFTHVMNMENVGKEVAAGTKIAEVGDPPGGPHIHIEVHNDASVAYNGGDPKDPYESLRGGLHDGTMSASDAQTYTMCPFQAYWEIEQNS